MGKGPGGRRGRGGHGTPTELREFRHQKDGEEGRAGGHREAALSASGRALRW